MIFVAVAIILLCTSPHQPSLTSEKLNTRTNLPSFSAPALLLAGCSSTSPLIPGIFLLSLYYQKWPITYDPAMANPIVYEQAIANIVGNAQLEVRVGYFGICVSDGGGWLCSNNATALAESYAWDRDPWNLIWVASTFKDAIVFPYLL